MKVAITIWEGRISPLFDSARRIVIYDIDVHKNYESREEMLPDLPYQEKIKNLKKLQIETLICGAISKHLACLIEISGIHIIPFIAGTLEEILSAYMAGTLQKKEYQMPGCCNPQRCFRRKNRCICPKCKKKRSNNSEDMHSY